MTNGFNTNRELFESNDRISHNQAIMFIAYEVAIRLQANVKVYTKANHISYKKFLKAINYTAICRNYRNCVIKGNGSWTEKEIMNQMDPEDNKIVADFNDNDLLTFTAYVRHDATWNM